MGNNTPPTTPVTPPTAVNTTNTAPSTNQTQNAPYTASSGLYGQLISALANQSQGSPQLQADQDALKNFQLQYAQARGDIQHTPIPLEFQQGREQVIANQYNSSLPAYQGAVQSDIQRQGLTQQALNQAAGLAAPQPYGLTTQPYNPVTDTYGGGGASGAINRAVQASNIGSAQDFQTKIQAKQAEANSADANFSILNSYAQGFGGDTPIINGLKQKFGTSIQGNEAVAGFQAQLQSVRSAYQSITGGDPISAIPDDITPNQLKQVQQALSSTAQNNITGLKAQIGTLGGGTQSSGGSMFGSFFSQ